MSGLNDDIDSGLKSDNPDYVTTPVNNSPDLESSDITLVNSGKNIFAIVEQSEKESNRIKDLFGRNIKPNELPDFHGQISAITTEARKDLDTSFVMESLKEKKCVSQEDAQLIDSLQDKTFLNDDRPIQYFTKDPSKTQFDETIQFLEKSLGNNKDYESFLENIYSQYTIFKETFKTEIYEIADFCFKENAFAAIEEKVGNGTLADILKNALFKKFYFELHNREIEYTEFKLTTNDLNKFLFQHADELVELMMNLLNSNIIIIDEIKNRYLDSKDKEKYSAILEQEQRNTTLITDLVNLQTLSRSLVDYLR